MAKFSDVNSVVTWGAATFMTFYFKLKEVLKSAGWTVESSGDGTTYSAVGDVITSAGVGAGGLTNTRAWYRIREPGGRRELTFQCIASGTGFIRIKYSALARFTGGAPNATTVPSATDEQIIAGGGTDAAPTGLQPFSSGTTNRIHIIANSTPINGAYPVVGFVTVTPGILPDSGGFVFEPMADGSFEPEDVDPVFVRFMATGGFNIGNFATTGTQGAWFAYGLGSQIWLATLVGASFPLINGTLPADLASGRFPNGPILYTAPSVGNRLKGIGATIAMKGPAVVYPTTMNRTTDARVYIGNSVVPYPDNTEPGV